ncbi:hypothetical protein LTR10_007381 [Elasticomyces elasticus]|nr:hypothetical protein LTR10_007381 [Elasticomyces elasticus]KAK4979192.1 hypothetical protein LTR42_001695 [Elasticomyces elasticus]
MSAPELVDAAGYISDESDFYGDEKMQKKLERKVTKGKKRRLDVMETPFTKAMAKRIKLDSKSPALPTPSPTPEVRPKPPYTVLEFLKSRPQVAAMQGTHTKKLEPKRKEPPRTLNGKRSMDLIDVPDNCLGDPSAWQRSETVVQFLRRAPVADPDTGNLGPWLWVSCPQQPYAHVKHDGDKRDRSAFLDRALELLAAFRAQRTKIEEAPINTNKAPGTITRYMRPYREQLEDDLASLAVETGVTCGKWMFFPSEEDVARVWRLVAEATVEGKLGPTSKVATYDPAEKGRVICVYTYNFADTGDVRRVLDGLVDLGLVSRTGNAIYYKCDAYTYLDIMSENQYKIRASLYGSKETLDGEVKAKEEGPILRLHKRHGGVDAFLAS